MLPLSSSFTPTIFLHCTTHDLISNIKTPSNMSVSEPHCYICLGTGDEIPPMGTIQDSKEWIKPCTCSFTAHNKCFYSWLSAIELERKKRANDLTNTNNNNNNNNENANGNFNNLAQTIDQQLINMANPDSPLNQIVTFTTATSNLFPGFDGIPQQTHFVMKCIQCRGPIMVTMNRSKILSYKNFVESVGVSYLRVGLFSTVFSCSAASLVFGATSCLSATGIKIITTLIPNSVQASIFKYKGVNMSLLNAVDKGLVNIPTFLSQTSLFPIHLFYLRYYSQSPNLLVRLLTTAAPLMLLNNAPELLKENATRWLFYSLPAKYLYSLAFSLTLNRLYYKWCKKVQPCFIADRLSLAELDQIEVENRAEYDFDLRQAGGERRMKEREQLERKEAKMGPSTNITLILRKILNLLTPNARLLAIKMARFKREILSCLKNDFTAVFQSKNSFIHMGTTLVWPYLGELVARTVLTNIPLIRELAAKYAATPDEVTYLINLYGCIAVVLIKDLFNLYMNYKVYQQYLNLRVDPMKYTTDEDAEFEAYQG